jgi:hypothetical protein
MGQSIHWESDSYLSTQEISHCDLPVPGEPNPHPAILFILILSCNLRLVLRSNFFPACFPIQILYVFLISLTRTHDICETSLIIILLIDQLTLTTFCYYTIILVLFVLDKLNTFVREWNFNCIAGYI